MFTLVKASVSHGKPVSARIELVEKLDLTNVRRKLMEPAPEGKGWSAKQAEEAEKWYKRYLCAIIAYPEAQHVPNGQIDTFWHQHILDTQVYGKDCDATLGYFLHHYPYFGLNGDAAERDTSFDETNEIYRAMYGEDCLSLKHFGNKPSLWQHIKSLFTLPEFSAVGCSGKGGNCAQGCRKGYPFGGIMAHGCTGKGSGTGCRQGCKRG